MHTGESAINRGLAKRLKDLEKERERRNRAAREDDLQFSLDFLSTSRKVFRMIDKDDSGTLARLTGRLLRREACIESALANKLAERAARRELQAKAAQKEIEEFTAEFKSAARRCFQLIDKDGGGTLSHDEIVEAVKTDQEVISFLKTCGEENLMFLLHPPRLKKALEALDADGSGEIDVEEWRVARRPFVVHRGGRVDRA